jgi:hypothetical protein
MKIIYNNLLPVRGFTAMAFFGVILARKSAKPLSARTINHEAIHAAQAKECGGWWRFYLRYLALWVRYGYRNNPFEVEAIIRDADMSYLARRTPFKWKEYG